MTTGRAGATGAQEEVLLRELGAHRTPHSRGTLLEHLRGTRSLLERWGNPPRVCRAGLFHSIYGTYVFEARCASLDERDRVRAVIGEDAEELAYLFCVTDRRGLFSGPLAAWNVLRDVVHDRRLRVAHERLAELVEIEVANVVDQLPRRSRTKALRAVEHYGEAFERRAECLSEGAVEAFRRCFSGVRAPDSGGGR